MAKKIQQPDVLVLGDHVSAHLAVALLRAAKPVVSVLHVRLPGEKQIDRQTTLNPRFFELHPLLTPLKRKLELRAVFGASFLADDPKVAVTHIGKNAVAHVVSNSAMHAAVRGLAEKGAAKVEEPSAVSIEGVDETGVTVVRDGKTIKPRALLVAGALDSASKRLLGIEAVAEGVRHSYTFAAVRQKQFAEAPSKGVVPMSLDLGGTLNWGWLLCGDDGAQLSVAQLAGSDLTASRRLLEKWATVLTTHGVLKEGTTLGTPTTIELPLGGALQLEGVANRALLIGLAGGFVSACAEEIYPACWSAVFAVQTLLEALQATHLQDALGAYRQRWGATLGDYLRGPQQNLRFLLPLIYRNTAMAARLVDAIFLGESVVR